MHAQLIIAIQIFQNQKTNQAICRYSNLPFVRYNSNPGCSCVACNANKLCPTNVTGKQTATHHPPYQGPSSKKVTFGRHFFISLTKFCLKRKHELIYQDHNYFHFSLPCKPFLNWCNYNRFHTKTRLGSNIPQFYKQCI